MEEQPVALATIILSPKQLRNEFYVRSFAASRARAGELEQRLFELTSLNGCNAQRTGNLFYVGGELVIFFFFCDLFFRGFHNESLFLGGAGVRANAAAGTIERGLTCIRNFAPFCPIAGLVAKPSGTCSFSSSNTGRIAA